MMNLKYSLFLSFFGSILFSSCAETAQNTELSKEYSEKAQVFIANEQFDSALFYLDKTLELNPKNYKSLTWKSSLYVRLQEFDKAIETSKKVVALQPHYAESWAFLGMLHDIKKDTIEAKACYATSIMEFDERILKAKNQETRDINKLNRAASLVLIGKADDAKIEYQSLLMNSDLDTAYINSIASLSKEEYLGILLKKEEVNASQLPEPIMK